MHNKQAKAEAKMHKKAIKAGFVLTDDGLVRAGIEPNEDSVKNNLAQKSTEVTEKNAKVRVLQLIVAIVAIVASAIIAGVMWQVF